VTVSGLADSSMHLHPRLEICAVPERSAAVRIRLCTRFMYRALHQVASRVRVGVPLVGLARLAIPTVGQPRFLIPRHLAWSTSVRFSSDEAPKEAPKVPKGA
jgi:hypothetical protein